MGEIVEHGWDNRTEFRQNVGDYSEFRYDTITAEDINWIVDDAIVQARQLAKEALESEELSWDPVMGRLFKIISLQEYAYSRVCFMGSVHPDKLVRDTAEEALLRFFRETCKIYFDPAVYEKLWEYSQTDEVATLYGERGGALMVTSNTLRGSGITNHPQRGAMSTKRIRQLSKTNFCFNET